MIIRIDDDEWFPCWSVVTENGLEANVPDDVVFRWTAAQTEWEKCQEQMSALFRWHGNWQHALEAMARGDG